MELAALLAGQRQDPAAGLRAAQHAVVLRRRHLRRPRYQTDAEQRQDQVQTNLHRPSTQFHHPRGINHHHLYLYLYLYLTTYSTLLD